MNLQDQWGLISAIITNGETLDEIKHIVSPEMFSEIRANEAYTAIIKLHIEKGIKRFTPAIIARRCPNTSANDIIESIKECYVTKEYAPTIAKNMKEAYIKKSFITSVSIMLTAYDNSTIDRLEAQTKLIEIINEINHKTKQKDTPSLLSDYIASEFIDTLENGRKEESDEKLVHPVPCMDYALNGIRTGQIYTIAARPGCGKTAILVQWLVELSEKYATLMMSLEMSREEVFYRAIAYASYVNIKAIEDRNLSENQFAGVFQGCAKLENTRFYCDDGFHKNIDTMLSAMGAYVDTSDIKIVGIDYLQLIRSAGKHFNKVDAIDEVMKKIKQFAKQKNVAVFLLSQNSRAAEAGKPTMGSLKGCGSIEEDSAAVISIWREEEETVVGNVIDSITPKRVILSVLKSRFGAICDLEFNFVGRIMRFCPSAELGDHMVIEAANNRG